MASRHVFLDFNSWICKIMLGFLEVCLVFLFFATIIIVQYSTNWRNKERKKEAKEKGANLLSSFFNFPLIYIVQKRRACN